MSDLRVSEHTRLSGTPDFHALADQGSMHVWMWDMGPPKPVLPARPKAPTEKEGTPAYDLAMIDFREAISEYESAMQTYKRARDEFKDFETRFGGPHEIMQFSCDALETLFGVPKQEGIPARPPRDAKRYCISSRTRGYANLKNRGLPIGVKPSHGQAAQELREAAGEAEFAAIRRADPVFGNQEARP